MIEHDTPKGEQVPMTVEVLQEIRQKEGALMERQGQEIASLKAKNNQLRQKNAQLRQQVERLEEALTPSPETKDAYWGEDTGDWPLIKAIMKRIKERAQPTGGEG